MKRKVRSLPQVVLLYVQKFAWKPGFEPARLRPLPGMFYALPSMCQPRKSLETIPFKIMRKLSLICLSINELQFTAGALSQIVIFHQFSSRRNIFVCLHKIKTMIVHLYNILCIGPHYAWPVRLKKGSRPWISVSTLFYGNRISAPAANKIFVRFSRYSFV